MAKAAQIAVFGKILRTLTAGAKSWKLDGQKPQRRAILEKLAPAKTKPDAGFRLIIGVGIHPQS